MYRHQRAVKKHSRPGKAHDFANLCFHLGRVAVDAAIAAEGLLFHKGTDVASVEGVVANLGTIGTEILFLCPMFAAAINADHFFDDLFFPFSFLFCGHMS